MSVSQSVLNHIVCNVYAYLHIVNTYVFTIFYIPLIYYIYKSLCGSRPSTSFVLPIFFLSIPLLSTLRVLTYTNVVGEISLNRAQPQSRSLRETLSYLSVLVWSRSKSRRPQSQSSSCDRYRYASRALQYVCVCVLYTYYIQVLCPSVGIYI